MNNLQFLLDSPVLLLAILIVGSVAWGVYCRIEAEMTRDEDESCES